MGVALAAAMFVLGLGLGIGATVMPVFASRGGEQTATVAPAAAPEMKAHRSEERTKAEAARHALKALLDQGEVGISRVILDKYGGRVLADASTRSTPSVAAALLDAGYVRRYEGARRNGWC